MNGAQLFMAHGDSSGLMSWPPAVGAGAGAILLPTRGFSYCSITSMLGAVSVCDVQTNFVALMAAQLASL